MNSISDATERICSIPDCGSGHFGRGWCGRHYARWYQRGGDPSVDLHPSLRQTPAERFWAKVGRDGPPPKHRPELGPCWPWLGAKTSWGYGVFWNSQRLVGAHRFAYELLVGPIPAGMEIDHLCRVPACVRALGHLEAVTRSENILRGTGPALLARRNAAVTHCPQGHLYDEANTYIRARMISGRQVVQRHCRACGRDRIRLERARRKDESASG